MARGLIAIIALGMLAFIAATAGHAALINAGDDVTMVNESFTPDAGNITTLDDSNKDLAYYDDSVTVYDENGTLMNTSDYTWFESNGTVKTLAGGRLDNDSTAKITYQYQLTTEEQHDMAQVLAAIPQTIGIGMPAFLVVFLLYFVRG